MFKQWCRLLLVVLSTAGLFSVPAHATLPLQGKSSISGQVFDVDGRPLEGVTVQVRQGIILKRGQKAVTNPGGVFTLKGIVPAQSVFLTFEKEGYTPTQSSVRLVQKVPTGKRFPRHKYKFLREAVVTKTLLKRGATQSLDPALGGSLSEAGFKVSFSPDSLTATAGQPVQVVITPVDVSTAALNGAPGELAARTAAGRRETLESFSMADFSLYQGSKKVNLKPGATAEIELLLPENTRLREDDVTPMWYFDTTTGLWQEEGVGRVAASTSLPNRLAVFASVVHFSWWNSDQVISVAEVRGRVVDHAGQPVSGAYVSARGVDYAGSSYSVQTDANGYYCQKVKAGSVSALQASHTIQGLHLLSSTQQVQAGGAGSLCANGSAAAVADLVLPTALACVSGTVLDGAGQPVSGVTVFTNSGSYTQSDAQGAFQLNVMESAQAVVYAAGYPAKTLMAPTAGSPCATVTLQPGGGGPACVTGFAYQCDLSTRVEGAQIYARDVLNDTPLGISAPTDANGNYCIDNLPAGMQIKVGPVNSSIDEHIEVNSGAGGGSCASNSCNAMPPMDIWCY
ncbi:carboxypeptidase-like regulatory domain-containing protein [Pseudomonas sp. CAU 1711]|uniref:carboxypeptidase-like regulatory domain-containing protein n=1 Tax=Pseudomonas sp. CAU 1711 TaxID=3140356 RepID=UPI003260FD9C